MRVVGTAGHVDHGKSTLVQRLTGIDPDRLREEKQRALTIDLGFAWLPLANGEMLGIIDVPGHRDFIENMLAGVGGIDAVVLVIAADEGVMPQTREHLAIIDLLGIPGGVIALTKSDLINDPEWLDLVELDIADVVEGTVLADSPIVPVSAHTGQGIDTLMEALESQLATLPQQADFDRPRLAADRVFTISGFGTVVTGTLLGGKLQTGDEIELQPIGIRGRVRGLQSYNQAVELAYPGSRVAVNISGVDRDKVQRGHVLTKPGFLQPTTLVDVHYRHLPAASRPLEHNLQVKVFSGAAESTARVRLLDAATLPPGTEGWLQLRLDTPMALARNDRFILRIPSPAETIGGGLVANPHPGRRWKRFQPGVIQALETLLQGTPAERLAQVALGHDVYAYNELSQRIDLDRDAVDDALKEAVEQGLLTVFGNDMYLATASANNLRTRLRNTLAEFHKTNPLRSGMAREELRSRLGIRGNTLSALLENEDEIIGDGQTVHLSNHQIRFTPKQQETIGTLMSEMNAAPFTPPSFSEATTITGEEVLLALIDMGDIIRVQSDVILAREAYETMVNGVFELIETNGEVDAKGLRDQFDTSRKYAIGLLEHLDSVGLTRRVGDSRVAGKNRSK